MKKIRTIVDLLEELNSNAKNYMDFGNQREKTLGIGMRIVLDKLKRKETYSISLFLNSKNILNTQ